MKTKPAAVINTIQQADAAQLSKGQKQFNKLLQKIEGQRQTLREWQESHPVFQRRFAEELLPLVKIFDQSRTKLVWRLDQVFPQKLFSKTDREKLSFIICDIIDNIFANQPDEELEQLYRKHLSDNTEDNSEEFLDLQKGLKTMLEEVMGLPIEENLDFSDPQVMQDFVERQEQEWRNKAAAAQQAKDEKNSKRKKTAQQNKREQEEKEVSLSIREVYRKLASALHPDRESDPTERKRKTALMQRVNVAYEDKDLLQLLELQLEIEQIDQSNINTLSDNKLTHYNKILTDQSKELQMEIDHFIEPVAFAKPELSRSKITPVVAMQALKSDIKKMEAAIRDIELDLREFEDNKNVKAMLKTYRIPAPELFGDDDYFDDFF